MEISNKTISILLLVAIISSLTTFLVTVNLQTPTGHSGINVTSQTGKANLSIYGFASITFLNEDGLIAFGVCVPDNSTWRNISSDTISIDCSGLSAHGDNITIVNDGNVNVNLSVKSSVSAATLIGGTNPGMWFATNESATKKGCTGSDLKGWVEMNSTNYNVEQIACGNLTPGSANNTVEFNFKIQLPYDAPETASSSTNLTFKAVDISP